MVQCCMPNCKNRSDCQGWKTKKTHGKVGFHRFPKKDEVRNLWLDILGIKASSISQASRVCSVHFKDEFFDKSGSINRLKQSALLQMTIEADKQQSLNARMDVDVFDGIVVETIPTYSQPSTSQKNIEIIDVNMSTHANNFQASTRALIPIGKPKTMVDKSTMVCPTLVYNSPEKSRLRSRIAFLEKECAKKLRAVNQRVRRASNSVISFKKILKELKYPSWPRLYS